MLATHHEPTVARKTDQLTFGDHVCLIHETVEEQIAAVGPFMRTGLLRGARCCYIGDGRSHAEMGRILKASGIDVRRESQRGALVLLGKGEAYFGSGKFDPDEMIRLLREFEADATAQGFSGVYATGEMTWALGPEPGCDRLVEYEARLEDVFTGGRIVGLCQYDRRRFHPHLLGDVVRAHPLVGLRGVARDNPFFDPARAWARSSGYAVEVAEMLATIGSHRASVVPTDARGSRSAGTVLVLETHAEFRDALAFALGHAGYTVITATSAAEATRSVRRLRRQPDLVVLGLGNAKARGATWALSDVRAALPGVPVVALSSQHDPVGSVPGAVSVLGKSSPAEDLLSAIAHGIRASHPN
jgi:CheY-like chemotaxis protein